MAKQKAKYVRRGRVIVNIKTGDSEVFQSVNKAKKESLRLQKESGGLGCGIIRALKSTWKVRSRAILHISYHKLKVGYLGSY